MPVAELMQYPDAARGLRVDIQCEYRDRELIKLVPGAKWDNDYRTWHAPLSWASCVQLRGVFGSELAVGPSLTAWSQHEVATRIAPCLTLRAAQDAGGLEFYGHLLPYQRAGVAFLATARQALCADEMGLGKTLQVIATLEYLAAIEQQPFPALIVCPNSMKFTWQNEYARWAPHRRVTVINGGATARRKQIESLGTGAGQYEIAIINFEALRTHTRLASYGSVSMTEEEKTPKELNSVGFRTVCADEAHKAKDPKAKQTRALWWMGDHAEFRYALTGTPIANSPEDAWAMMRFVSPAEFPAKTKFVERYALQSWNIFGFMEVVGIKPEAEQELFKIIDPRMIRRLKASVLPQLPDKTYATRYVEMGTQQKKAYTAMRKDMLAQLETGILMARNPLTQMTRLKQFASAYGTLEYSAVTCPTCQGTGVADNVVCIACQGTLVVQQERLILTEPSCKLDALEEILEELGSQQVVVFAESKQLIDMAAHRLVKAGVKVGFVTGGEDTHTRQQYIDAFQRGDIQILLLTFGAGAEGITLTAASTMIFLQRTFNFVQNQQAEARIHRMGQQATNVTYVDIITRDSVEERVHDALREKGDQLEQFVRDAATLKEWLGK